jgi:hypothetical protein
MTFARADARRDRFATVPFEDEGGSHPGRYYQDIAVERVLRAPRRIGRASGSRSRRKHQPKFGSELTANLR